MCGIYQIRCVFNNKIYIGSTVSFSKRFAVHRHRLRKGKHHSSYLQNSWDKYGESNFIFEILEEVPIVNLIEREQFHLDLNQSFLRENGYNQAAFAGRSTVGRIISDETRLKLIEARKRWSFTEETKKKMSEIHMGKKMSEIAKQNMSKNGKGVSRPKLFLKLIKCLKILNIPYSSRTTIYQVINGKRDSINGFKIINMR